MRRQEKQERPPERSSPAPRLMGNHDLLRGKDPLGNRFGLVHGHSRVRWHHHASGDIIPVSVSAGDDLFRQHFVGTFLSPVLVGHHFEGGTDHFSVDGVAGETAIGIDQILDAGGIRGGGESENGKNSQ